MPLILTHFLDNPASCYPTILQATIQTPEYQLLLKVEVSMEKLPQSVRGG